MNVKSGLQIFIYPHLARSFHIAKISHTVFSRFNTYGTHWRTRFFITEKLHGWYRLNQNQNQDKLATIDCNVVFTQTSHQHWPLLGRQGAHLRPLGHGHVAHPSVPGVDAARLAHQGGRLLLQSEEDGLLGHRDQEYQQTLHNRCTESCIRRLSLPWAGSECPELAGGCNVHFCYIQIGSQ